MLQGTRIGLLAVSRKGRIQLLAGHDAGGDLGDRRADGLGDERHRARSARIDFEHVDRAVLDGELDVHQAADIEGLCHGFRLALQLVEHLARERARRQRAGAIAGMDAGFLDVFHDAGDIDVCAVGQAVDVHLYGVAEIAVEQQRVLAEQGVDLAGLVVRVALLDILGYQFRNRVEQVRLQLAFGMQDLHGAAAKHVGRAHDQREADFGGDEAGLLDRVGDAIVRLIEIELHQKLLEAVAVFGKVDHVGRGAEDRDAVLFERFCELQRGLAAELDDDADDFTLFLLCAQNFDHVFGRQRLEIEAIGGVVVGGNRFRVAVDHDCFIAGILQRESGMAAAIVELDTLADTVRAATEDDHLLAVGDQRLGARSADEGVS